MDFKIDPLTGDLALDDTGDLVVLTGRDAIAQHIRVRLQFVLGEWHLDQREGIPYFEQIWVTNPDLVAIEELFRRAIAQTPGVASVRTLSLTHDTQARTLSMSVLAVTTDGEEITSDDFTPFALVA